MYSRPHTGSDGLKNLLAFHPFASYSSQHSDQPGFITQSLEVRHLLA